MAGMRDVAKLAGVSLSTVSVVLNQGKKYVSPENRARVLDAARQLGYRLPTVRPFTQKSIAVILPTVTGSFFSNVLTGIESITSQQNTLLLYYNSDFSFDVEQRCISTLKKQKLAGLILDSACPPAQEADYLAGLRSEFLQRGVPVLFLERKIRDPDFTCIFVDNYRSSYEETEYLLRKGRREIAYIRGNANSPHSEDRLRGYLDALKDYGAGICEQRILQGDYTPRSGFDAAKALLCSGCRFDALLSANDQMAVGAMKAFREAGLRIPQDIPVAGFDDLSVSSLIEPALSTVHVPTLQMGTLAARILLGQEEFPQQNLLQTSFIARQSTEEKSPSEWNLTGW